MSVEYKLEQLEARVRQLEQELQWLRAAAVAPPASEPPFSPPAHVSPVQQSVQQPEQSVRQPERPVQQPERPMQQPERPVPPPAPVYTQPPVAPPGYPPVQAPGIPPAHAHAHAYAYDQQRGYAPGPQPGGAAAPQWQASGPHGYGYGHQPYQAYQPGQPKPKKDWEHDLARVWLPRVFIVVLLLGVLWGFVAAVNANYITEEVRCAIGALAAVAMYVGGVRQMKRQREGLGKVLLGGANAVFALSCAAAYLLYGIIPQGVAALLYAATIGIGVWTAVRWRSQTLVALSVFSGYLMAFMLDLDLSDNRLMIVYLTVFSIAMLVVSALHRYVVAYWLAFGMLHASLLVVSLFGSFEHAFDALLAVVVQHVVAYIIFVLLNRAGGEQTLFQFTAFCSFALWSYLLYGDDPGILHSVLQDYTYASLIGGATLLYAVTAGWLYRKEREHAEERIATSMAIATLGLFLLIVDLVGGGYIAAALTLQGLLALWLGLRLRYSLQQAAGTLTLIIGSMYTLSQVPQQIVSVESLSWIVLLLVLPVLYAYLIRRSTSARAEWYVQGLLWTEAVLALILISLWTNIATSSLTGELRHFVLSLVWLCYAIGVIVAGVMLRKPKVRLAGLLFLLLVLLKVIFNDFADVSLAVRALLFIALGVGGIAVSRLLYNKKDK